MEKTSKISISWYLSSVIRFNLRDAFRIYYLGQIVLLEAFKKLCNLFTRFSKEACYTVQSLLLRSMSVRESIHKWILFVYFLLIFFLTSSFYVYKSSFKGFMYSNILLYYYFYSFFQFITLISVITLDLAQVAT